MLGKPTVATVPPSFTVRLAAMGTDANFPAAFNKAKSFAASTFKRMLQPSKTRRVKPSCAIISNPIGAENILSVHEFTEIKRTFRSNNYSTGAFEESVETVLRPLKIWPGKAKL